MSRGNPLRMDVFFFGKINQTRLMFQHAMFDYQRIIQKNLQLNPIKSRERVTVPESKKVDELTSHEIP
jgi:hypothetical protein